MTAPLPESLSVSFLVAAAELGMASAARLFVEEIARARGSEGVAAARDAMGRDYAVFDSVATWWLEHAGAPQRLDPKPALDALAGARRVLVIGTEADALDALVPSLDVPMGLVAGGGVTSEDVERNAANYPGRLEVVPLDAWGRWAGAKSALLTFVYGADEDVANVSPAYLRLVGPDVRSSFRSLIGWNLLGARPRLHPRYFAETSRADFSLVLDPPTAERP